MSISTKKHDYLSFFCCLVQQASKSENSHLQFLTEVLSLLSNPNIMPTTNTFLPCSSPLLPGSFSCLCILNFCKQQYIVQYVYPELICIGKAEVYPPTLAAALIPKDHVRGFYHLHLSSYMRKLPHRQSWFIPLETR